MTPCERAIRYSKAPMSRLRAMESALLSLDHKGIEGDIVECGVWRGGHIILARVISPSRVCWLFDTFSGMTAPGPHDVKSWGEVPSKKQIGKSVCALESVKDNLRSEQVFDEDKLRFVVGDVNETLRRDELPDKIALLRLDTDWYESTKIELEVLFPRLGVGGVLIVDDYGHWMGAKKAVRDYFGKRMKHFKAIDYSAVMLSV